MKPEAQAPSVEHLKLARGNVERHRHPAFGLASIKKTQDNGPAVALFGSQVQHRTVVLLRIETAYGDRELNRDWHHADKAVVEVAMSEAQLAALITSSTGERVPVTFTVRPEEDSRLMLCPEIANTETPTQTFERELMERCGEYLETAQALTEALAACASEGQGWQGKTAGSAQSGQAAFRWAPPDGGIHPEAVRRKHGENRRRWEARR